MGSGFSSKMSDNVHSLPVLGDAEILAVTHLPLEVIPQLIKRGDHGTESSSLVVAEKSLNVFKDEMSRPFTPQYSCKVIEKSPSGIIEPQSFSSDAERLARESSDQEVEVGESISVDCGNVSVAPVAGEVSFIGCDCVLVDF